MNDLATKRCVPCEGGIPRLDAAAAERLIEQIPHWSLVAPPSSQPSSAATKIERTVNVRTFRRGVSLIGQIADLAEQEHHHPDLHLTGYRHLRIVLTTHAIGGLSENDFILAAKIDQLLNP